MTIDTVPFMFIKSVKHIGLDDLGPVVVLLRKRARLVGAGSVNVHNVDPMLPHQSGEVLWLDDDRNAEAFQLNCPYAAAQTTAGKDVEPRPVEVPAEDLQRLFRASQFQFIGEMKKANLGHRSFHGEEHHWVCFTMNRFPEIRMELSPELTQRRRPCGIDG